MRKWKLYQFALFVAACILLNFAGRMLAARLRLPLWLDSLGTVLCAYLAGPVCGAIVGLTGNLIYGMANHVSYVYGLTSVALGVIVGIGAKRRALDTVFGTLTVSALAAAASILISVPLNIVFYGGSTGNLWGDGVIGFMRELGMPWLLCVAAGEFYIDFADKLLSMVLLFLALRAVRLLRGHAPRVKRTVKTLSLLMAAGLCLTAANARADALDYKNYVQTLYSSGNGLPCGEANDIAQTSDGILWIGTYAGLYRYNGREFRWMDEYDSVRNVNCLYVDQEGRLWIGTNDNGLSIAINEQIVNVVDESMGLPSNSVRSIIQSADGYYYVGTTGSMQVMNLNSGLKKVNTLWEVNYADDIDADDAGHVAAVTSNGRLFLLKKAQIVSSRQLPGGGEIFKTCHFDAQGRLLAGTTSGHIYVFDISRDGFDLLEIRDCPGMTSIKDLYFLENGDMFITADNGVGYMSAEGAFSAINTNDFNNSIDNMLIDYQGNLWFTSSRLGLLRMAASSFRDVYSTLGMTSQVVNVIVRWQGEYLFGTDKGLDAADADCKTAVTNALTQRLEGVRIRCMMVDSDGHLWVCTYGQGLLEVTPAGEEYWYNAENGSFGSRARVVSQLSDGVILAAGDTGISYIRDHQILRTIGYSDGLINSMILTVLELPDGLVLAGTDGDGIAVLEDGQVIKMLTREDGLSSEVILRMVFDPKGDGVFIVTSNGLCYLNGADRTIRTLDNFPYFNNYNVYIEDEDTLFVMSSAGIYVMDREELLSGREDVAYELLNTRRGLNSAITANSWNYADENGDLYLPCDTGVFIVNTRGYSAGSHSYRMTVAGVRLDGEPYRLEHSSTIQVDRSVSKIEISPEIINYTIQDPYVGYCLTGFDSGWTIQPQSALSAIVYTNLPPGSYTLRLAVFDSDQRQIVSERSYGLVKEKEIYDNSWFVIYMLLIPMVAVAWLTWYIVRTQVQRTLDIQKRELSLARQQVQMGNETIMAIAKAVDAKDERTSQHSVRVSAYSVLIAKKLGFSDEECENLRKSALMHDIGKIGIPDSILNKPARLTDEEYSTMKSHTTRGAEILKHLTLIDHVVEGALHHHERFDGRGYPNGLKGDEIPLYARIIGVADAFDAMTANRVYRKQMDFGYVFQEMRNGKGSQFDPQMVDILMELIDEGAIDLNKMYGVKTDAEPAVQKKEATA